MLVLFSNKINLKICVIQEKVRKNLENAKKHIVGTGAKKNVFIADLFV